MEKVKFKVKEVADLLPIYIDENKEVLIFCHANDLAIGHGIYEDFFDKQYCEERNLPMLNANFPGGACVIFKGDINIMGYVYGFSDIAKRYIECANDFLHSKGIESEIIGNDLIIRDGETMYKVGSHASAWVNNDAGIEFVAHISMHVDNDLIQRICKKSVEKYPKALSDYGITEQEVIEYLNKNFEELKGQIN